MVSYRTLLPVSSVSSCAASHYPHSEPTRGVVIVVMTTFSYCLLSIFYAYVSSRMLSGFLFYLPQNCRKVDDFLYSAHFTDKETEVETKSLLQGYTDRKWRNQNWNPEARSLHPTLNVPPAGPVGQRLAYSMIHPRCIFSRNLGSHPRETRAGLAHLRFITLVPEGGIQEARSYLKRGISLSLPARPHLSSEAAPPSAGLVSIS